MLDLQEVYRRVSARTNVCNEEDKTKVKPEECWFCTVDPAMEGKFIVKKSSKPIEPRIQALQNSCGFQTGEPLSRENIYRLISSMKFRRDQMHGHNGNGNKTPTPANKRESFAMQTPGVQNKFSKPFGQNNWQKATPNPENKRASVPGLQSKVESARDAKERVTPQVPANFEKKNGNGNCSNENLFKRKTPSTGHDVNGGNPKVRKLVNGEYHSGLGYSQESPLVRNFKPPVKNGNAGPVINGTPVVQNPINGESRRGLGNNQESPLVRNFKPPIKVGNVGPAITGTPEIRKLANGESQSGVGNNRKTPLILNVKPNVIIPGTGHNITGTPEVRKLVKFVKGESHGGLGNSQKKPLIFNIKPAAKIQSTEHDITGTPEDRKLVNGESQSGVGNNQENIKPTVNSTPDVSDEGSSPFYEIKKPWINLDDVPDLEF